MAAPLQSSDVRAKQSEAKDSKVNLSAAHLATNVSLGASPPAVAGFTMIASQPATRRTTSCQIKPAVATNIRGESNRSSKCQRAWKQRHWLWPAPLPLRQLHAAPHPLVTNHRCPCPHPCTGRQERENTNIHTNLHIYCYLLVLVLFFLGIGLPGGTGKPSFRMCSGTVQCSYTFDSAWFGKCLINGNCVL